MKFFIVLKRSKKSKARLGVINTKHGSIHTPAFVPVATKGTLKTIPPKDLRDLRVQTAFVNTFHLTVHPGVDVIKKFGGIHKYSGLDIPLMSDSGGFQVFSLGEGKTHKAVKSREGDQAPLEKISEEGVRFRSPRDGKLLVFTPEFSMQSQEKIGADLIMAFDECMYYGVSRKYAEQATLRTHRWLVRCIEEKRSLRQAPFKGLSSTPRPLRLEERAHQGLERQGKQFLYGIIQGGVFKDLRIESAKFVTQQDVDGVAIGGVSVGESKKELREQVRWVAPYLPEDKPVHLLGIGRVEDILDAVSYGIDTFDCVELTRLARSGVVYCLKPGVKHLKSFEKIDLMKGKYLADKNPIQKGCRCYTCQNFSLSFLHHLFKEHELLAYYLASYHNLFLYEEFFRTLRYELSRD